MIQILHNPRCSKSRGCLAFLEQSGKEYEVINYLKADPSIEELRVIISKLTIKPLELVRKKEPVWIEKYEGKNLTDADIIQAMAEHPILIERPIVINGEKAVIGRPVENAASII